MLRLLCFAEHAEHAEQAEQAEHMFYVLKTRTQKAAIFLLLLSGCFTE